MRYSSFTKATFVSLKRKVSERNKVTDFFLYQHIEYPKLVLIVVQTFLILTLHCPSTLTKYRQPQVEMAKELKA